MGRARQGRALGGGSRSGGELASDGQRTRGCVTARGSSARGSQRSQAGRQAGGLVLLKQRPAQRRRALAAELPSWAWPTDRCTPMSRPVLPTAWRSACIRVTSQARTRGQVGGPSPYWIISARRPADGAERAEVTLDLASGSRTIKALQREKERKDARGPAIQSRNSHTAFTRSSSFTPAGKPSVRSMALDPPIHGATATGVAQPRARAPLAHSSGGPSLRQPPSRALAQPLASARRLRGACGRAARWSPPARQWPRPPAPAPHTAARARLTAHGLPPWQSSIHSSTAAACRLTAPHSPVACPARERDLSTSRSNPRRSRRARRHNGRTAPSARCHARRCHTVTTSYLQLEAALAAMHAQPSRRSRFISSPLKASPLPTGAELPLEQGGGQPVWATHLALSAVTASPVAKLSSELTAIPTVVI